MLFFAYVVSEVVEELIWFITLVILLLYTHYIIT